MKKNKMMRLASSLLVAVLLTSSVISGTFAKYVTEDTANDSARVARFGVTVTVDGSLFEDSYIDAPATGDTVTVKSLGAVGDNVVAPGTKNADNAFTFKITGTPEVDVKLTVEAEKLNDIYLGADTYSNMTTAADDEFTLADDYHPIKYTLKKEGVVVAGFDGVTLEEIVQYLNDPVFDATYKAGTDLNGVTGFGNYELTWKWDFEDATDMAKCDAADTFLGNIAAGTASAANYSLITGFKLTIRVEQVN